MTSENTTNSLMWLHTQELSSLFLKSSLVDKEGLNGQLSGILVSMYFINTLQLLISI